MLMDKYSYLGYIDEILDKSEVSYHHLGLWFRLFLENDTYSIKGIEDNGNNKVVVYKGSDIDWCINTKVPIAFQGTLQGFENWLKNNK